MFVVVTGSRHWQNPRIVWSVLEGVAMTVPDLRVGVGDCPTGGDLYTREWCEVNSISHRVFYARWDKFGRAAGPIRNREMVDTMNPHRVLAFLRPGSRGTRDCAEYAASRSIPVHTFWETDPLPSGYKWNDVRGLK